MNSEIVYYEPAGRAAVHSYGQTVQIATEESSEDDVSYVPDGTSASFAGAQFDVGGVTYTGSNPLVIDYSVGPEHSNEDGTTPDWVTYNVTHDGENYYVSTFTANVESGNSFTMSGNVQAITDSDGNVVYQQGADDNSFERSDLTDETSATIQDVSVSTGSGADDDTYVDMYYYGVSFDGTELFEGSSSDSFTSLTLEPGSTQLAVENSLDLAAVPGGYTVTTDVEPDTGE
jgi:hypothetical protein